MIIIRIMGGLGNQMQQYALYRKLLSLGKNVKLDLSWFEQSIQDKMLTPREFELGLFTGLPYQECSDAERDLFLKRDIFEKILEKTGISKGKIWRESEMFHPEIFEMDDRYVEGYFACQKYYDDIMPELRNLFAFPYHSDQECQIRNVEMMNEMEQRPSVSVHIRRGDYLAKENAAILGNIATDEYYNAAMAYFRRKNPDTHFYIFTSDTDYARATFTEPGRYTIIDWNTGKNSLQDLQLMSHCQGNICANSTFSFWGARLNKRPDHEVVRTLTMRNNQPCDPTVMHDLWKGWILIDKDGTIV